MLVRAVWQGTQTIWSNVDDTGTTHACDINHLVSGGIVFEAQIEFGEHCEIPVDEDGIADILSNFENIDDLQKRLNTPNIERVRETLERELKLIGINLVGASPRHSIILYLLCDSLDALDRLNECHRSGHFQEIIQKIIRHVVGGGIPLNPTVDDNTFQRSFQRCRVLFGRKVSESVMIC